MRQDDPSKLQQDSGKLLSNIGAVRFTEATESPSYSCSSLYMPPLCLLHSWVIGNPKQVHMLISVRADRCAHSHEKICFIHFRRNNISWVIFKHTCSLQMRTSWPNGVETCVSSSPSTMSLGVLCTFLQECCFQRPALGILSSLMVIIYICPSAEVACLDHFPGPSKHSH